MALVPHDHLIETFPAERADDTLGDTVRLRCADRRQQRPNADARGSCYEVPSIARVPIADPETRRAAPGSGGDHLPPDPGLWRLNIPSAGLPSADRGPCRCQITEIRTDVFLHPHGCPLVPILSSCSIHDIEDTDDWIATLDRSARFQCRRIRDRGIGPQGHSHPVSGPCAGPKPYPHSRGPSVDVMQAAENRLAHDARPSFAVFPVTGGRRLGERLVRTCRVVESHVLA